MSRSRSRMKRCVQARLFFMSDTKNSALDADIITSMPIITITIVAAAKSRWALLRMENSIR